MRYNIQIAQAPLVTDWSENGPTLTVYLKGEPDFIWNSALDSLSSHLDHGLTRDEDILVAGPDEDSEPAALELVPANSDDVVGALEWLREHLTVVNAKANEIRALVNRANTYSQTWFSQGE